ARTARRVRRAPRHSAARRVVLATRGPRPRGNPDAARSGRRERVRTRADGPEGGGRARGRRCARPFRNGCRPTGDPARTGRRRSMIRVGLVGCGHIGTVHAYALQSLTKAGLIDAQLTATYDEDADRAVKVARHHGGEPVATVDALLDAVDVVWVC